jgi:uncharacterized protein YndB with AHSA1/START domain
MNATEKTKITVSATVSAPLKTVWHCYTAPEHIVHWNFASPDWHCPKAENDLQIGGMFNYYMAAKDGSFGFDFSGKFTRIIAQKQLDFVLDDGRTVSLTFEEIGAETHVTETFEAESENSLASQQEGWQAILNNFKEYVESLKYVFRLV